MNYLFLFHISNEINIVGIQFISMNFLLQVTIWWAGLMRGAVSMALAYNQVSELNNIDCASASIAFVYNWVNYFAVASRLNSSSCVLQVDRFPIQTIQAFGQS